jgi:hypothetical protein
MSGAIVKKGESRPPGQPYLERTLEAANPSMSSGDRSRVAATNVGSVVALLMVAVIPLVLWAATEGGGGASSGQIWIMALAGVRFAWIVGTSRRHLFEMVFWLFTYVFMGMAPYVQQRLAVEPSTTTNLDHSKFLMTTVVVLIGCLAVLAGSSFAAHRSTPLAMNKGTYVDSWKTTFFTCLSLAFGTYYLLAVGPASFLLSRVEFDAVRQRIWSDSTVNALVVGGATMPLLVSVVALVSIGHRRTGRRSLFQTMLFVLALGMLLFLVNPISSPRYIFGTVVLSLLAAFGAYSTMARYRIATIGALFGLVVIFPLADAFRYSVGTITSNESPLESLLSGDFDASAQVVNTLQYVDQVGISWGQQLLGVLFFWVPRSLWEEKAVGTGRLLAEYKGYSFGNLSAPIWSELYIDWSWPGLIIGMFMLGLVFRKADAGTDSHLITHTVPPLLGCILPFYMLIVLRGSLLAAVAYLVIILVSTLFVREGSSRSRSIRVSKRATRKIRPD